MHNMPKSVAWQDGKLRLLDQRRLPCSESYITLESIDQVYEAIQTLAVRGAPAIGIAAAYGLLVGLERCPAPALVTEFERRCDYLTTARPTAVNLPWAIHRMRSVLPASSADDHYQVLLNEAKAIHAEQVTACGDIAGVGLPLVQRHPNVLTHCNAGSLAVSELGTALAPIYLAQREGVRVHVFVDETRPLLQGARLTAWELTRNKVDCTLITDNMAAHVMSQGRVDMVLVGGDRVAANGDVANKIGTLNLAILCQFYRIPLYVAVPLSTIDPGTARGADIIIEQGAPEDVTTLAGQQIAPIGVKALSPAFDVTPAALITGIMTEAGLLRPPYDKSIPAAMKQGNHEARQ